MLTDQLLLSWLSPNYYFCKNDRKKHFVTVLEQKWHEVICWHQNRIEIPRDVLFPVNWYFSFSVKRNHKRVTIETILGWSLPLRKKSMPSLRMSHFVSGFCWTLTQNSAYQTDETHGLINTIEFHQEWSSFSPQLYRHLCWLQRLAKESFCHFPSKPD